MTFVRWLTPARPALAAVVVLLTAGSAAAQISYTWVGFPDADPPQYSGTWSPGTGLGWSPDDTSPGPLDFVTFPALPQAYTVTIQAGTSPAVARLDITGADATLVSTGGTIGTGPSFLTVNGPLALSAGTLVANTAAVNGTTTTAAGSSLQVGYFESNGTATINGELVFGTADGGSGSLAGSGSVSANGTTTIYDGGVYCQLTLNAANTDVFSNLTVESGSGYYSGATTGQVVLPAGNTLTHHGDGSLGGSYADAFIVRGTFVKVGVGGDTATSFLLGLNLDGGVIEAQVGTVIVWTSSESGATLAGTLRASNGAAIELSGPLGALPAIVPVGKTLTLEGAGAFQVAGADLRADGEVTAAPGITLGLADGGILSGTGTVAVPLVVDGGRIRPGGDTAGTLTAQSVTLDSEGDYSGVLTLDIRGGDAGNAKLVLTGADPLTIESENSYVRIELTNDGTLVPGQSYTWTVIETISPITGVTPEDFAVAATNFEFADDPLVIVGANVVQVSFTPVPEPTGIVAVGFGVLATAVWLRRRS